MRLLLVTDIFPSPRHPYTGTFIARRARQQAMYGVEIDVLTTDAAQDALAVIDKAINDVSGVRGDLGAFQSNTLENTLNNLRVAQENLVAAESVIRDTDMASEVSSFTRGQILVQTATAMLAQANATPNIVLQLLK